MEYHTFPSTFLNTITTQHANNTLTDTKMLSGHEEKGRYLSSRQV
jgi:hypothetical protein